MMETEDSCVFVATLVPLQKQASLVWKHKRTISMLTTAVSLAGNIMALYLNFKSTAVAAVQFVYLTLLCEPPRFYVVLLLLFLLLIMLVKAGIFDIGKDEAVGERGPFFYMDVSYDEEETEVEEEIKAEMGRKALGHEKGEEEQLEKEVEIGYKGEGNGPIAIYDNEEEEEEAEEEKLEGIESFNRRADAFISSMKLRFLLER